jgi:predicted MFS family arabinose efflux permease
MGHMTSTLPQPETAVRPSARSLLTLGLLGAATLTVMTTETLPVGLLAQMSEGFGVQQGQLGLLVTAYGAVVVVGAVPLSIAMSRVPARAAMLTVLGLLVASIGMTAASTSLNIALVARIIGGAAHAVFYSCSFTVATSVVDEHWRGRAVALVGAGNALALALGVPAATALGAWLGWPVPFWVAVVVLVAVMITLGVTYRPLPEATGQLHSTTRSLIAAIRNWSLARVTITIVLVMGAHFTTYTYIAPILDAAGVPTTLTSVALVAFGIAGVAALVMAGRYSDSRPRLLLRLTVAVTLVAVGLLWLFRDSAGGVIAALTLWGLAFGAAPVLWQLMAVRAAPAAASIGPAVVNSAFNVGISLGALGGRSLLAVLHPADLALPSVALLVIALALVMAPRWLPTDRPASFEQAPELEAGAKVRSSPQLVRSDSDRVL